MVQLDELNQKKGVATNAMCLFLAISTSGLAVSPTSVIAARAAVGAKNLTGIVLPSVLSRFCAAIAAVVMTKLLERMPGSRSIAMRGEATGRRVKVYETLVQGATEGFNIAVLIIPFMVALLLAVGMFRASGAMDVVVKTLAPITSLVGFPAEALPMALIRPLSGSGSLAVMTETMKTYDPDSFGP